MRQPGAQRRATAPASGPDSHLGAFRGATSQPHYQRWRPFGAGPLRALLRLAGAGLVAAPWVVPVAGTTWLGGSAGGGVLGSGVRDFM